MTTPQAARWPGDDQTKVSDTFFAERLKIEGTSYHRHRNGGGLVADTAHVAPSAFVGLFARVSGNAEVFGNAEISGNAKVFGDARVSGNAEISGNARVFGNSEISGDARVSG